MILIDEKFLVIKEINGYLVVMILINSFRSGYRWPHQPLLFKKNDFFFEKNALFWLEKLISNWLQNFNIKLTLKNFEFSYQNKEKYQKKKIDWEFDMLAKKFDQGIWRFLIGVWPIYRSKCIPNTYQIFILNTYQTPISLSRREGLWSGDPDP
jgi:hypothetical protein